MRRCKSALISSRICSPRLIGSVIPLHAQSRIHTSAVRTPVGQLYFVWMFEADLQRR
jgi:hypothetical protein